MSMAQQLIDQGKLEKEAEAAEAKAKLAQAEAKIAQSEVERIEEIQSTASIMLQEGIDIAFMAPLQKNTLI